MLFVVSVCLAAPLLVPANMITDSRPEDSVASPVYLVLGVLGLLLFAMIGNALGDTAGTIAATLIAGAVWLGAVLLGSEFSEPLLMQLPLHVITIVTTVICISVIAIRREEVPHYEIDETIQQLGEVKRSVRTQLEQPQRAFTKDPSATTSANSAD
jgi:hypothetical protein